MPYYHCRDVTLSPKYSNLYTCQSKSHKAVYYYHMLTSSGT